MRIAILTGSKAVSRSIHSLLEASGFYPCEIHEAECCILDSIHPLAELPPITLPTIQLGGGDDGSLPCPLPTALLLQALQRLRLPQIALKGGWWFDPAGRTLGHPDYSSVMLTEKESELLHALACAGTNGITRDALLLQIWGMGEGVDTHTLETHLYRLRSKLNALNPLPAELHNENGVCKAVIA
jgi:Transcriptional regulatory protein, C terminal